jgi:hypothetical protein
MTWDGTAKEEALHNAIQVKFKPLYDKGKIVLIEKANDFYRIDSRSMAQNHGWLPPSGDASRAAFQAQ